jgi:hypothetical protein
MPLKTPNKGATYWFKIFGIANAEVNAKKRRPLGRDLACGAFYAAT